MAHKIIERKSLIEVNHAKMFIMCS